MPGHWYMLAFTEWACREAYHIEVLSDTPCHLWLRWTNNPPWKHDRARWFRGLPVMGDVYYCFNAYNDIEQEEAGDTTMHTFTLPDRKALEVFYFYFHGQISAIASPSESPIFGRQLYFTKHDYFTQVQHENDEASHPGGNVQTCPAYCPYRGMFGRWQTPAKMLGAGVQFCPFDVPKCAYITASALIFTAYQDGLFTQVMAQISHENTITPPSWYGQTTAQFFTRYGNRAHVIDWDNVEAWYINNCYGSPDISAVVQGVVNMPGWEAGMRASFFIDDFAQRTPWYAQFNRAFYMWRSDPVKTASIWVIYDHWQVKRVPVF